MDYSRRDFLKVAAAGLPVVGASWFCSSAANARAEIEGVHRGAYGQARADRIHNRSMEEEIRQAGEKPEEVKAWVNSRLR